MAKLNDNKSNRRVAFRVYEQANLFYQKIDSNEFKSAQSGQGTIHDKFTLSKSTGNLAAGASFPSSKSQENDTLNVNISSSGIAFTCAEQLKAGDFLMLRILFLSSMTVVATCCKVVYCKPSNPYETNRHPYSIGAQFVNMTAEDSALLNRHVGKKRKQQFVVNGTLFIAALAVLAAPGHAFTLLVTLFHHALEIVLHMLHLAFEFLEMGLDHYIEHHFHTDTHKTQVIVFYTIVTLGLVPLYFLGRMAFRALVRTKQHLAILGSRKKSSCLYFWKQQSVAEKAKIIGISASVVAGYFYFGL